jgi:hypothetical protein
METIEYFSDFLRKIGGVNFLAVGILLMVIWLLISGFRTGLRKRRGNRDLNDEDKKNGEE